MHLLCRNFNDYFDATTGSMCVWFLIYVSPASWNAAAKRSQAERSLRRAASSRQGGTFVEETQEPRQGRAQGGRSEEETQRCAVYFFKCMVAIIRCAPNCHFCTDKWGDISARLGESALRQNNHCFANASKPFKGLCLVFNASCKWPFGYYAFAVQW